MAPDSVRARMHVWSIPVVEVVADSLRDLEVHDEFKGRLTRRMDWAVVADARVIAIRGDAPPAPGLADGCHWSGRGVIGRGGRAPKLGALPTRIPDRRGRSSCRDDHRRIRLMPYRAWGPRRFGRA
jgi:hypothetical protein